MTKSTGVGKGAGGGRPTEYKPVYADQLRKLCLLGAIDKEIADFFNISVTTLNTWKKKYPKFLLSAERGKIIADAEVANKLYQRVVGYDYQEFSEVVSDDKRTITEHDKHMAPDIRAIQFWLKNRRGNVHSTDQGVRWKESFTHTDAEGNAFALHIHKECLPGT